MKRIILPALLCLLLMACSATATIPAPATPVPPTNTPTGTIVIEGGGTSIRLPSTYFGGNNENLDEVLQKLDDMGSAYKNAANVLKENHNDYIIFAYDSRMGSTTNVTNILIGTFSLAEDITLESQTEALYTSYEDAGGTHITSKTCKYEDYECLEFQVTFSTDQYSAQVLQYLIKKGKDAYMLTFSTGISEFEQRYDEFSQDFSSFKINE